MDEAIEAKSRGYAGEANERSMSGESVKVESRRAEQYDHHQRLLL